MTPEEKRTEKIKLMQLFKQGKIDNLPDVDSDAYKAQKVKDMMSKAEGVDEVTSKVGSRISGMIHRPFLANILEKFAEIYQDLIDNGEEFDAQDVIDFLSIEMSKFADDRGLNASLPTNEEKVEETTYVWGDVRNALKDEANASESEIEAYIASLERDIKLNGMDDYKGYSTDDYVEDFKNYIADKSVDEGVKWMKRFSGVK